MNHRRAFLKKCAIGAVGSLAWLSDLRAAGASRAPKLKISAVKAVRLKDVNNQFVRLYTDGGAYGTGETFDTVGAPVAAHGMFSPLGTMASAHFCATRPNLMSQEWGRYFLDSFNRIATKPSYRVGYIEIRDTPGIGVELNAAALKEMVQPGFSL